MKNLGVSTWPNGLNVLKNRNKVILEIEFIFCIQETESTHTGSSHDTRDYQHLQGIYFTKDGGSRFHLNIVKHLKNYAAL